MRPKHIQLDYRLVEPNEWLRRLPNPINDLFKDTKEGDVLREFATLAQGDPREVIAFHFYLLSMTVLLLTHPDFARHTSTLPGRIPQTAAATPAGKTAPETNNI